MRLAGVPLEACQRRSEFSKLHYPKENRPWEGGFPIQRYLADQAKRNEAASLRR